MDTFIVILGWVAAVLTVALGLPQLIKTIKTKETSGVNFYSMFIFGIGLGLWVIFAGHIGSNGYQPGIANILSLIIFASLITALFKFKGNKYWWLIGIGVFIWAILVIALFSVGEIKHWSMSTTGKLIMSAVAGCCTTFAFFPQVIKTFRTKNVKGLSIILFILGAVVNILWTTYWGFLSGSNEISVWIMPCVLSAVGALVYGSQIVLISIYKKRA